MMEYDRYCLHGMFIVDFENKLSANCPLCFIYVIYCIVIMNFIYNNIESVYRRKNLLHERDGWGGGGGDRMVSFLKHFIYCFLFYVKGVDPYNRHIPFYALVTCNKGFNKIVTWDMDVLKFDRETLPFFIIGMQHEKPHSHPLCQ